MFRVARYVGYGLPFLILLGGCGESFDQMERDAISMTDRIYRLEVTEDMPQTGSARFTGMATVDFGSDPAGLGLTLSKMTLNANFAEGTIDGSMHDWATDKGNRLDADIDGSLAVFGGTITDNTMSALATGRLTASQNREARVVLGLDGIFRGENADAVAGVISGDARYATGVEVDVIGAFGAER